MLVQKDSNELYHQSPGISASGLKTIFKKSIYHYLNQKPFESSSMAFGSAVHCAMLEPDEFYKEYHVMPKLDRRTKDGKSQYELQKQKASGKILLSYDDFKKIEQILVNFREHDLAQKFCKGDIEYSHYTKYDDIEVRIRPDVLNKVSNFICDVKTCQDNSPMAFKRDVYKYAYHLQAAFYMDMLGINDWRFVAVQNTYPYTVEVYALGEELIEQGRRAWQKAFSDYKLYIECGIVSGYNWNDFKDDGSLVI